MRARSLVSLLALLLLVPQAANAAPGDLDTTFGDGGRATAAFGGGSGASDVALVAALATPASASWEPVWHRTAAFSIRAAAVDDDLDAVAEGLERVVTAQQTGPIRDRGSTATVLEFPKSL
jgi:hypothetical protein